MSAFEKEVEEYIRRLPWSPDATEDEKTLVIGNIRTAARLFRDAALAEAERLCRARVLDPGEHECLACENCADAIAALREVDRGD